MKLLTFTVLSIALSLAVFSANAQSSVYLATDLGLNLIEDVDLSVPAPGGGTSTGESEFDPGARLGLAIGNRLTPWLAVELESGILYNPIKHSQSWLANVPLMGNIVFRYESDSGWTPYIGAGAGGSLIFVNINEDDIDEDDTDIAIAFQGLAGVRYRISDRVSVGLGYKYLRTTDTEFTFQDTEVEVDGMGNHSIGLTVTWDF